MIQIKNRGEGFRFPVRRVAAILALALAAGCGKESSSGGGDPKSPEEAFAKKVRNTMDKVGDFAKGLAERSELEDRAKELRKKIEALEKDAKSAAGDARKRVEDAKAGFEKSLTDLRAQFDSLKPIDDAGDPKIKKQMDDLKKKIEADIAAARKKLEGLKTSGK